MEALHDIRSVENAEAVARRIAEAAERPVVIDGLEVHASASIGCHKAQGCHFARPLPADGLEGWLPVPSLPQYEEEIWG